MLDLLHRLARPHDGVLGYVPGIAGMHDVDDYPDARPVPGLLVYRYDAPLCFANAENFRSRALAAVDAGPEPPRWFLLNAEANVEIDTPPPRRSSRCTPSCGAAGSCWRSPASSRTCA